MTVENKKTIDEVFETIESDPLAELKYQFMTEGEFAEEGSLRYFVLKHNLEDHIIADNGLSVVISHADFDFDVIIDSVSEGDLHQHFVEATKYLDGSDLG